MLGSFLSVLDGLGIGSCTGWTWRREQQVPPLRFPPQRANARWGARCASVEMTTVVEWAYEVGVGGWLERVRPRRPMVRLRWMLGFSMMKKKRVARVRAQTR
jgi:hypothetical protein